jgi:hypothetical protein
MLAYFHYCNKGSHPFAMDWTIERNIRQAELNPDQLRFLTKTTQLVEGNGKNLSISSEDFKSDCL